MEVGGRATGSQVGSESYERLVQSVLDYAICRLDPDGRVVTWNPGAEHIYGFTPDAIIGQPFTRLFTPDDKEAGQPEEALKAAAKTGRFSAEGPRLRSDGERFWALDTINAIRDGSEVTGFVLITRDVSEIREAIASAFESERRFRLLVQGVTDYAIFMLDPEGVITNWNAGAQRIKGYAADEIVGRHFSAFYTPEDLEAKIPVKALETARREGRFIAEGWRLRKDGTRFWANVVIDPVRDDDGQLIGFAKVTRDLTERREAQLQLEASQHALFQAQKMEAVGQLTGGLAHDFNNLLTGITGSLELLRTRIAQGRLADVDRYITAAMGAAGRAANLTHRLLAFSRQQTLEPRAVDANRLVSGMEDMIRRTLGPAVALETVLAVGLWPCLVDANQLENALLNLCINARDAMPEGGQLTIETANAWVDAETAHEREMSPGQYVAICVTDTGCGMAPDMLERVFDPFFTTKPVGQGTGLGLSMIYGFAKQSGGQVRLYSEVGVGTTAKLFMPRHRGKPEEIFQPAERLQVEKARSGETVLIVDDEPTVRMLIADTLAELGYQAIEAGDAASGLRVLESDAQVDLLITDVGLPGAMSGKQMVDTAREKRPKLKVLFITGYAENAILSGNPRETGLHVMSKPFAMERLAARIKAIIDEA